MIKCGRHFPDKVKDRRHRLALYAERLDGCSPLKKLQQGYSYTESPDGKALTSITQVKEGDALTIHVTDGTVVARTEGIRSLKGTADMAEEERDSRSGAVSAGGGI